MRAAAEFASSIEVEAKTTVTERITITNTNGQKTGESRKELDDEARTRVQAVMKAPPTLGTWRSEDGKLFFYALGARLPR